MIFHNYKVNVVLLGILISLCAGCEKFGEQEKYERPDWLPGKLYTTVSAQDELTMFAECLRNTGLDSIVNISGSWSIFAPTDEAMAEYLAENHYATISDIPADELERITEFHVVQNPWSLEQLQILSAYGWKTGDNKHKDSYAYKRQTIFKNPVDKYWIKRLSRKEVIMVDSTVSDGFKRVFVESRKHVPIFYDGYVDYTGLTSEDYRFYFDRGYEPGNVYYAGAKILRHDILAENGFLHVIDRVVDPMLNAKEILDRELPGESYKLFLEMVYWYYPAFEPNMVATYNQPEVRQGGYVDTLWSLDFSDLAFALHRESTGFEGAEANETFVKHNGLFAPTDDAFREFIDGTLTVKSGFPHWTDHKSLPWDIVEILISRHFKTNPIYPSTTTYKEIFGGEDGFQQNDEDIIRKEFGSNCTFIGLNKYIPDQIFTSVTGPVFLRPNYSLFRRAMLYAGIEDDISNHEGELYFFPIPDHALNADSSLLINWIDRDENEYNFMELNRQKRQVEYLGRGTIRNRILNHVGTPVPNGDPNKVSIRTLGGKYITWDRSNNTIRGTRPSTFQGNVTTSSPVPLDEPTDNGKAWSVSAWFKF